MNADDGQISIFDMEPVGVRIGGCGGCVCTDCMKRWQMSCPYGECFDDYRAEMKPYDAAHPGVVRKGWSHWNKPKEQAHWCRGGDFFLALFCEKYTPYIKPRIMECLNAPVTVWADGRIDCALVDAWGCEECMRIWEQRRAGEERKE